MNVLVDSSIWVAHFKLRDERLVALLEAGMVVCHPYVVVEVACGTPPNRRAAIAGLEKLETVPTATPREVLVLIERHAFFGRGCGFVDLSLLASALLSDGTRLWTLDRRLDAAASELDRAWRPANHA